MSWTDGIGELGELDLGNLGQEDFGQNGDFVVNVLEIPDSSLGDDLDAGEIGYIVEIPCEDDEAADVNIVNIGEIHIAEILDPEDVEVEADDAGNSVVLQCRICGFKLPPEEAQSHYSTHIAARDWARQISQPVGGRSQSGRNDAVTSTSTSAAETPRPRRNGIRAMTATSTATKAQHVLNNVGPVASTSTSTPAAAAEDEEEDDEEETPRRRRHGARAKAAAATVAAQPEPVLNELFVRVLRPRTPAGRVAVVAKKVPDLFKPCPASKKSAPALRLMKAKEATYKHYSKTMEENRNNNGG